MKVAKLELYLTSLASLQRSAKSKCRIEGISVTKSILHPFLLSFLPLPDVLCDPTYLIWRHGTPFEAMTGRTAPSSDGLLAQVFLGCKANARRSVHSPQDHFIITIIFSD